MTEYDNEPIPGLPGIPPAGERILWQGSPDCQVLARTAFHTRLVGVYFAVLVSVALITALSRGVHALGDLSGVGITIGLGIAGLALLNLLAWNAARTTIYTLTDRRMVFRLGMALPKCINLPLGMIGSVDMSIRSDGTGDLPLVITGQQKIGYLLLWPSARPWKIGKPQPMLRAIPQASDVGALIARTCLAANPHGRIDMDVEPAVTRAMALVEAVAA